MKPDPTLSSRMPTKRGPDAWCRDGRAFKRLGSVGPCSGTIDSGRTELFNGAEGRLSSSPQKVEKKRVEIAEKELTIEVVETSCGGDDRRGGGGGYDDRRGGNDRSRGGYGGRDGGRGGGNDRTGRENGVHSRKIPERGTSYPTVKLAAVVKLIAGINTLNKGASSKVNLMATVGGTKLGLSVDTLASLSCLEASTWKSLGSPRLEKSEVRLRAAGGGALEVIGEATIELCLRAQPSTRVTKSRKISVRFIVVSRLVYPCILGRDAMESLGMSLHYRQGVNTIEIDGVGKFELTDHQPSKKSASPVLAVQDFVIQAGTQVTIAAAVKGHDVDSIGIVSQITGGSGYHVASSISKVG